MVVLSVVSMAGTWVDGLVAMKVSIQAVWMVASMVVAKADWKDVILAVSMVVKLAVSSVVLSAVQTIE